MQPTVVGLFTGLLLGIALIVGDFADMLVVAFLGAIGYFVMKVFEGELDVGEMIDRNRRQRQRP
jgi:ABC-type phosphate transport system permease subunit